MPISFDMDSPLIVERSSASSDARFPHLGLHMVAWGDAGQALERQNTFGEPVNRFRRVHGEVACRAGRARGLAG